MALLEPVGRGSAVESVLSRIKEALVEGKLNPGDKLPPEMELMDMLGVGRGTVREALKILSAFGVIEIRRGEGTYIADAITPPCLDPLLFSLILERGTPHALLELREMLEFDFIRKAIEKATDDDLSRIEHTVRDLKEQLEAGETDPDVLTAFDLEFHYAVIEASKNPLIIKLGKEIMGLFSPFIKKTMHRHVDRHHEDIYLAIKARDVDKAREALERSLWYWTGTESIPTIYDEIESTPSEITC